MQPLLPIEHIPNIEIGLISELEPEEDKANQDNKPLPYSYLYFV